MGKQARTKRHLEKMKARRSEKQQKNALYASLAGKSPKKGAGAIKRGGIKIRDPKCKNIGDLRSHPEMGVTVMDLYIEERLRVRLTNIRTKQYTGRYKGVMKRALMDIRDNTDEHVNRVVQKHL
jgi:hypothetical protein